MVTPAFSIIFLWLDHRFFPIFPWPKWRNAMPFAFSQVSGATYITVPGQSVSLAPGVKLVAKPKSINFLGAGYETKRKAWENMGKNGKMMGKHGKKWENDGETMGNPRKMMGKHGKKWENDGETMGNPRKMDGESLK